MDLINATRMVAGYALGMEPSGRELLVVVVKGTFQIPAQSGGRVVLHDEQAPLVMSDVFYGEPGLSAPKYEIDFAPRKHRCDVLLNGTAHAPGGRPAVRVNVGIRIGSWSKSFAVVGNRVWYVAGGARPSSPVPFITMPITYDHAFGGTDMTHEDPAQHAAFMPNPSGRGFHRRLDEQLLEGSLLPNTEEIGVPVDRPEGIYTPKSFGALGRHWEPRYRYAGTYDARWLSDVFPFLPPDFDEQYYQAAPLDQQLAHPAGETTISLLNLTPDSQRDFTLPHLEAPITIFPKRKDREEMMVLADTVVIEPDLQRLTMTWRATLPLKKGMFEISEVLIGRKGSEWWSKREQSPFPIPVVVTHGSDRENHADARGPSE
jgi:hypothetical protein